MGPWRKFPGSFGRDLGRLFFFGRRFLLGVLGFLLEIQQDQQGFDGFCFFVARRACLFLYRDTTVGGSQHWKTMKKSIGVSPAGGVFVPSFAFWLWVAICPSCRQPIPPNSNPGSAHAEWPYMSFLVLKKYSARGFRPCMKPEIRLGRRTSEKCWELGADS